MLWRIVWLIFQSPSTQSDIRAGQHVSERVIEASYVSYDPAMTTGAARTAGRRSRTRDAGRPAPPRRTHVSSAPGIVRCSDSTLR